MKKITIILSFLFLGLGQSLMAQGQFNISAVVGVPYGDFMTNVDRIGGGLNASLLWKVGPTPVYFGVGGGWIGMGRRVDDIESVIRITAGSMLIDEIPLHYQSTISNNIVNGNLVMRMEAPIPFIKPYVEGTLGFRYLYTSTRIENLTEDERFNDPEDNEIASKTQLSDFALSYGGGAGIKFDFGGGASFDIKAVYTMGTEAEYYTKEAIDSWAIEVESLDSSEYDTATDAEDAIPDITALPSKSFTDMVIIHIGFTFEF